LSASSTCAISNERQKDFKRDHPPIALPTAQGDHPTCTLCPFQTPERIITGSAIDHWLLSDKVLKSSASTLCSSRSRPISVQVTVNHDEPSRWHKDGIVVFDTVPNMNQICNFYPSERPEGTAARGCIIVQRSTLTSVRTEHNLKDMP
jgi:hypothetical protein